MGFARKTEPRSIVQAHFDLQIDSRGSVHQASGQQDHGCGWGKKGFQKTSSESLKLLF